MAKRVTEPDDPLEALRRTVRENASRYQLLDKLAADNRDTLIKTMRLAARCGITPADLFHDIGELWTREYVWKLVNNDKEDTE